MPDREQTFTDFINYSISAPKRIGKSFYTIIFYGILLYLIMAILIKIPGLFTQSFYQPGEGATYQHIKDEGLLALYSFIINAKNYLFISIIIFVCQESDQKGAVSISTLWQQIRNFSKPLLLLIPTIWAIIYISGLLIDPLANEMRISLIHQLFIKPVMTIIFLINVVSMKIFKNILYLNINKIINLVKVINYKILLTLYIASLALLYNYPGLIYNVRNPLVRKLTEDKTINPMDTLLKINYGFELLAFIISIVVITITAAIAIYAVRSVEKEELNE
ncbi:MAG: hypothetical protein R3D86_12960 [Emcibacteraceae bacterium]